jgi:simple sugar transport system permease protein
VSPALRAGVIAVGAEGQMITGAIAAATFALSPLGHLPALVALPAGAVVGMLGGALWSMIPAVALLRWRVNEILTALLANFLATQLLTYLLRTFLRDPDGYSTPRSAALPVRVPFLPVPGRLTAGVIVVAVLVVVGVWWHRSRAARMLDVFAESRWLAARLGLGPARAILATTGVSGAAAGLAGWLQVAGVDGRLTPDVAGGIGFTGLVVAVLGANRPAPIVIAGLVMASLTTGANGIQLFSGTTPASIGVVTQGVLLLAVALALALTRRHRLARGTSDE